MSATGFSFFLCVYQERECKTRQCPNYLASSVLLSECIGKPGSGATRHIFMHTIRRDSAIITIEPIEMARGMLATRQRRLVEAWAELHQQELLIDWERLQTGRPLQENYSDLSAICLYSTKFESI
jgi:hypothetical protein